MKYDSQYWRGFLGGLRWIVNHYAIEWDLFREIEKKQREVKKKINED